MKKIAMLLILLLVAGAAPGWCLVATVDNYVISHTENNPLRPVADTGRAYRVINEGIDTSLDKVAVIKLRPMLFEPIDHVLRASIDGTRTVVNGIWDVITFKSMRDKEAPAPKA